MGRKMPVASTAGNEKMEISWTFLWFLLTRAEAEAEAEAWRKDGEIDVFLKFDPRKKPRSRGKDKKNPASKGSSFSFPWPFFCGISRFFSH